MRGGLIVMAAAWALAMLGSRAFAHDDVAPGPPALSGLQRIIAAYPAFLSRIDHDALVWTDGTHMPLEDLGIPDRDDGPPPYLPDDPRAIITQSISAVNAAPIFRKMYGDCRTGEVAPKLVPVRWLRGAADGGTTVQMTSVNGVADRLQAVSDALDDLPPEFLTYLRPLGGTYACRNILFSNHLSLHSFGIAIDINPAHGDYWAWAATGPDGVRAMRHQIPEEIVDIFERNGFVWGGRWNQFDTFHFEYRPEYVLALGGKLPPLLSPGPAARVMRARAGRPERRRICFIKVRQPGPRFGQCLVPRRPP